MVAFVRSGMVEAFSDAVPSAYHSRTGISSEVFAVNPVAGAGVIEFD